MADLCRPPPRRCGRASISAALEDTAVALLAGLTLAISKTSKPGGAHEGILPSTAFPSARRLEMQTRGNTGAFRCSPVSLSSNDCNITYCQGCNVLLIPAQKYNKLTIIVLIYNITPRSSDGTCITTLIKTSLPFKGQSKVEICY